MVDKKNCHSIEIKANTQYVKVEEVSNVRLLMFILTATNNKTKTGSNQIEVGGIYLNSPIFKSIDTCN